MNIHLRKFSKVFLLVILPTILAIVVSFLSVSFFDIPMRFLVTILLSVFVVVVSTFFLGLCNDEKVILMKIVTKLIKI